jgi:hypothetical protein
MQALGDRDIVAKGEKPKLLPINISSRLCKGLAPDLA